MQEMDRRSGVAMWRQIADEIRRLVANGTFPAANALPGEIALASRFGVNRHTVRSAIAALVQEGLLRAERGRGTFVEKSDRLRFPIGRRTRFSEALAGGPVSGQTRYLAAGIEAADERKAQALDVDPGAPLVRIDLLYMADGLPVSVAGNWFAQERFDGIAGKVRASGSVTVALREMGVPDYHRAWTVLTAGHGENVDLDLLQLAAGAIVLTAEAVNVDEAGRPIQFVRTRFAADRVELRLES
jgi:GntR family transcriptional regulator, phosphonate transport system regulatory protein